MKGERLLALDALRGIAIAGMVFSGLIPYGVLPAWMYHAQNPPPTHAFNPGLPGISWVDLVFPLFLFAMGAAIPLALAGVRSRRQAAIGVVRRAVLLALFASYVRHISLHIVRLETPLQTALFALAGFALLFPMFARLPASWHPARAWLRGGGWLGAALLMFLFRDAQGARFDIGRNDIIILVLANVSLTAGLIWLATRDRPAWRGVVLCFLLALRLGHDTPGWAQMAWNISPLPALVQAAFQQYLFVVIPGLFAGDYLLRMARQEPPPMSARMAWLAFTCVAMVAALVVGLFMRAWWPTALLLALGSAAALRLAGATAPAPVMRMAVALLAAGMALEPYEGGIQKGRATLSFYCIGAAAATLLLVALYVAIDVRARRGAAGLVAGSGQNPLVAYAGEHSLLMPLLALAGVPASLALPAAGVARAALYTALLCLVAAWCARRKIVLRI